MKRKTTTPIQWVEENLIDPETNRPFCLLPVQRDFMRYAFQVGPDGKLLYPEWVFSAPKKSGKSGFGALLSLVMAVLYGGRHAEIVCGANSQEQSASRVFLQIKRIIEASPELRGEAKITADRILLGDATITAIASDAGTAAGGNQNLTVFDELWGFTTEADHRFFDEHIVPPTRKIAARLTTTYAGFTGESTLLEALYNRGKEQPELAPGLHAGDGILMAWHHEPIAPWQDARWLKEMQRQLRPNQFLRMIRNEWVSAESSFVEMSDYDRCVDPDLKQEITNRHLSIFIGLDGSVRRDWTALVAVTVDKNTGHLRVCWHRIFRPTKQNEINFEDIVNFIGVMSGRFKIMQIAYDPHQWVAAAQLLAKRGVPMERLNQTSSNLTAAGSALYEAIKTRSITFYESDEIRLAMSQTAAIESGGGWKITKSKSSSRIDPIAALSFAVHAATQTLAEPEGICHLFARQPELAAGLGLSTFRQSSYGGERYALQMARLSGGGYWGGPRVR
jgi:phage terminase large subunit-like protein